MNPCTLLTNFKQNKDIFNIIQKEDQNLPHCLSFNDQENKNKRQLNLTRALANYHVINKKCSMINSLCDFRTKMFTINYCDFYEGTVLQACLNLFLQIDNLYDGDLELFLNLENSEKDKQDKRPDPKTGLIIGEEFRALVGNAFEDCYGNVMRLVEVLRG